MNRLKILEKLEAHEMMKQTIVQGEEKIQELIQTGADQTQMRGMMDELVKRGMVRYDMQSNVFWPVDSLEEMQQLKAKRDEGDAAAQQMKQRNAERAKHMPDPERMRAGNQLELSSHPLIQSQNFQGSSLLNQENAQIAKHMPHQERRRAGNYLEAINSFNGNPMS